MSDFVSIFFHNYYGQHRQWIQFFAERITVPFNLYYNIVENSIYNMEEDLAAVCDGKNNFAANHLQKIVFRHSSNKGKDIGGKLVLMDAFMHLKDESEYLVFLHDKKSPYKIQSREWQQKLFRIVESAFTEKALTIFKDDPGVGIIAGADSIYSEYDHTSHSFASNNDGLLHKMRGEYDIRNTDYRFVAGTMFWVRSLPLLTFFKQNAPLDIRKDLEQGNIMDDTKGTLTHTWERMLSWLVNEQGYKLKGI